MKTGFIGLGNMGSGMAANLVKAGHDVTVYNRTRSKMGPLIELGAHPAAGVADACGGDIVITMLADDHALESVVFGEGGMLENMKPNAVHISMSTISIELSRKLAAEHAKKDQRYIAAPVFGRPEAAVSALLFIVAGGPADAVKECSPVFDALGQKMFHLGEEPFSANVVKLSGNFLIATIIEALGEAVALVSKADVDKGAYIDFLTSSLFAAPVFKTYGNLIAAGRFEPAGFAARLGKKDVGLVLAASDNLGVPMPIAGLLRERLLRLIANGGGDLDWSAISKLSEEDAGAGQAP